MPAAHGRVEDLELEDLARLGIVRRRPLGHLRPQGLLDQEADERVRRVVGAGGLAAQADAEVEAAGRDLLDPLDLGLLAALGRVVLVVGLLFGSSRRQRRRTSAPSSLGSLARVGATRGGTSRLGRRARPLRASGGAAGTSARWRCPAPVPAGPRRRGPGLPRRAGRSGPARGRRPSSWAWSRAADPAGGPPPARPSATRTARAWRRRRTAPRPAA